MNAGWYSREKAPGRRKAGAALPNQGVGTGHETVSPKEFDMFSMFKKFVKAGLAAAAVAGLVGVGAALIAGPARSRAVLHQMQENIHGAIDQAIDDPTALRTQLEELEKEFPA